MKTSYSAVLGLILIGFIATGCQPSSSSGIVTEPQASAPAPSEAPSAVAPSTPVTPAAPAEEADAGVPVLTFDNPVHDFGLVGPSSVNSHEFTFTNTGNGLLKIDRFHAPCGCTVPQLTKKEYAPGESGKISVRYTAPAAATSDKKPIYIYSNDPKNPQFELTLMVKVQVNVSIAPTDVSLLLDQENAGMPTLTIQSLDGQPFSITSITVTNNVMTIPFDADKKETQIDLKPVVQLDKLDSTPNGVIQIKTNHPQSGTLMVRFTAKPQFEVSRPRIILQNVNPGEESLHDIWIRSNYNTKVEIESFKSTNNYMTIQEQTPDGNNLKIAVKITPPSKEQAPSRRYITDELQITLKSGQTLSIRCSGWFKLN